MAQAGTTNTKLPACTCVLGWFRSAVLLLLIPALLAGNVGVLVILAGHQLNKEYIAKVLCINRDKPELACEGKCHLRQQLQQHQDATPAESERPERELREITPLPASEAMSLTIPRSRTDGTKQRSHADNLLTGFPLVPDPPPWSE
jgi:hypothetical protein